jgi:hypothetical protein
MIFVGIVFAIGLGGPPWAEANGEWCRFRPWVSDTLGRGGAATLPTIRTGNPKTRWPAN